MGAAFGLGRGYITPVRFGGVGDGVANDTTAIRDAFAYCSENNTVLALPYGKSYRITGPLYLWGGGSVFGPGELVFDDPSEAYLIAVGLSTKLVSAVKWTGEVAFVKFRVTNGIDGTGGSTGRIFFFFRTEGAKLHDCYFDVGPWAYSATSSGNNANWLAGEGNYIRSTISVYNNRIDATSQELGSEGYGFGQFDGIELYNNRAFGVGDDPVGIHYCTNVVVRDNYLSSVDGRIYVSQSQGVEIYRNLHERIGSRSDGTFHEGIALIYVGFELYANPVQKAAPEDIHIHDNVLRYRPGAIDAGSAIYLYATRATIVEDNTVITDASGVTAAACLLLPAALTGTSWVDPSGLDPVDKARVYETTIRRNRAIGAYPRGMLMTGAGADFIGPVSITDNFAASFTYYGDNVSTSGNTTP